jgi:hypothetical protein
MSCSPSGASRREQKMKLFKASLLFGLIIIAFITVYLFTSKIYYPPSPIEGLSKKETVRLLRQSDQDLVLLIEDVRFDWYGYKGNQLEGSIALKTKMKEREWTFKEQLGSGYIFHDRIEEQKIVESQMWTGKYVLYKVQKD